MSEPEKFSEGYLLRVSDTDFVEGLRAAVDYRGDCTLTLDDGSSLEGYIFNSTREQIDLYPKNDSRVSSIPVRRISSILFSGVDTAKGKSWEDWMKKKASEAQPHP